MADYWISTYGTSTTPNEKGNGVAVNSSSSIRIGGIIRSVHGNAEDATYWEYDTYGQFQRAATVFTNRGASWSDTFNSVSQDTSSAATTVTYDVTVVNNSGNKFSIADIERPILTFSRGNTYVFDQSESSNSTHQLALKTSVGASYTTGVTTTGTPGTAGANVTIVVASDAPDGLRYYCTTHGDGMGNTINVNPTTVGNNTYFAGYAQNASSYYNPYIQKVDNYGVTLWERELAASSSGPLTSGVRSVVDSAGNVIITCAASNGGTNNVYVAKFNASGTLQWQKYFNPVYPGDTNSNDLAYCVAVDSNDNIFIGGEVSGSPTDMLVIKLNSSGVSQWQRCINISSHTNNYNSLARGITVDSSDNVIVCGTGGYFNDDDVFWKLNNSNGLIQWGRQLKTTGKESAFLGVTTDSSDNIYLVGFSQGTTGGATTGNEGLIAKYNSAGSLLFQRSFNTNPSSYTPMCGLAGITLDSNNDMIITGYARPDDFDSSTNEFDMIVIKLPNDGTLTGTYGQRLSSGLFTYEASSHTNSSVSGAEVAATETNSTASFVSSDPGFTNTKNFLLLDVT